MFTLLKIEDKTLINPEDLSKFNSYEDLVIEKLRAKMIGKVHLDLGIVVSIKSLVIQSNLIVPLEGVINVEVQF